MPSNQMTHGVYELKNLMGEEIGHISCVCRLTHFGRSLLPHIELTSEAMEAAAVARRRMQKQQQELTDSSIRVEQQQQLLQKSIVRKSDENTNNNNNKSNKLNMTAESSTGATTPRPVVVVVTSPRRHTRTRPSTSDQSQQFDSATSSEQHIPPSAAAQVAAALVELRDAQVQMTSEHVTTTTSKVTSRRHVSTQSPSGGRISPPPPSHPLSPSPPPPPPVTTTMVQDEQVEQHDEVELVFNHYCPPPLHYNTHASNSNSNNSSSMLNVRHHHTSRRILTSIVEQSELLERRVAYLSRQVAAEAEQHEQRPKVNAIAIEAPQRDKHTQQQQQQHVMTNAMFARMPLLKCLMDEMSQLKDMMMMVAADDNVNPSQSPQRQQRQVSTSVNKDDGDQHNPKRRQVGTLNKLKTMTIRRSTSRETVNRLAKPRHTTPPTRLAATNVTKKANIKKKTTTKKKPAASDASVKAPSAPLVYGTTHSHRLRVMAAKSKQNNTNANEPAEKKQPNNVNERQQRLVSALKANLDEINETMRRSLDESTKSVQQQQHKNGAEEPKLSSSQLLMSDTLQKNLEKMLLSATATTSITSLASVAGWKETGQQQQQHQQASESLKASSGSLGGLGGTGGALARFSLLNKVELESTCDVDTINNRLSTFAATAAGNSGKVVQFGNAYVLQEGNQPHLDEMSRVDESVNDETTTANANNSSSNVSNIFVSRNNNNNNNSSNKNYEDDFVQSSLDSSNRRQQQQNTAAVAPTTNTTATVTEDTTESTSSETSGFFTNHRQRQQSQQKEQQQQQQQQQQHYQEQHFADEYSQPAHSHHETELSFSDKYEPDYEDIDYLSQPVNIVGSRGGGPEASGNRLSYASTRRNAERSAGAAEESMTSMASHVSMDESMNDSRQQE